MKTIGLKITLIYAYFFFLTKRNNCWETLKVTNEHLIPMKSITFYSSFYCQAKNNFEMMSKVLVLKSFRFMYE